ncbi:MAG: hypothetical protein Fur0037_21890 [Planctomycetota bacterium]
MLGRGGMGVVYRARQESLGGRKVALKVLPRGLAAQDPGYGARFRREAKLAAGIHHPNLAEVYGCGEAEGLFYFAMRLVEGRTLQDALVALHEQRNSAALSPSATGHVRRCVEIARDLAGALAAIHQRGFVHRDVKPANVILEGGAVGDHLSGRPVLVDFGLLRPVGPSDLTRSRTLLGTPAYASPESQLGREVDARADVFSLGSMLYDLLTVTRPEDRLPATAGLPDVRSRNPAVDDRLAAVLDMAMQDRPQLRYADAQAMREDLDRHLGNRPVAAKPESWPGRVRLWARRNPATASRILIPAGLVALLLVAIGSWFAIVAMDLTACAAAGRRAQAQGDVIAAAASLRPLLQNQALITWMPWLADDLGDA